MGGDFLAGKRAFKGKRCVRKSVSLTLDQDKKSKLLATSCDMPQAELLSLVIHISLNSPNLINMLQDRYNVNEQYRIRPVEVNGELEYL